MHKRSLFFAFAPILAVVLVAVLLYAVRSSSQPPPIPDVTSAGLATAIPFTPTTAPKPAAATSLPSLAPTQGMQDTDIVALVNGEAVGMKDLALAQAIDKVMSGLLGAPPTTPAQLIDQLINHALVAQQAASGSPAPTVDAESRLAALLSSAGKTQAELADALVATNVESATFDQYFADLLTVQEFANKAAAAQGRTVDAYITELQTAARISYGPAAALAAQAAAVAPQVENGSVEPRTEPAPLTQSFAPVAQAIAEVAQASSVADADVEATPTPTAADAEVRGLEVGQLAPDFALTALESGANDGAERQVVFDDLLGEPVVLSFWTTWCPYCLRQTPVLVAAAGQYSESIRFVGIDVAEDAATVAPYVEQHAIPYTILLDQKSQAAAAYAVEGFPTTYFLDASGRIVARQIGALSEEQLQQYVQQLLISRS